MRPRFNADLALEKFRDLAAPYTDEKVQGRFHWRNVPTLGWTEWSDLRSEVEGLKARLRDLDATVFANGLQEEGARTEDFARLHAEYLDLIQEEKRLTVDEDELRARMIQRIEDFEAIAGICSYGRVLKPKLDGKSFRKAHQREADECCIQLRAEIRRRIFQCRSY